MAEPNPRADEAAIVRIALGEMRGVVRAPRLVAPLVDAALGVPARALARSLARLDADIASHGLAAAGKLRLAGYGVAARSLGPLPPASGPVVVVSNHPGLFDALALFQTIGRDDLATLAADRPLLAALPHLRARLAFIKAGAEGAFSLRPAARRLAAGGALLHFPAGEIEPDPALAAPGSSFISTWKPGLEPLLALGARRAPATVVVAALVSGVISRRARSVAGVLAGRRAATDAVVPLLQLTFPGFTDLDIVVRFAPPRPAAEPGIVANLRADLERLAPPGG